MKPTKPTKSPWMVYDDASNIWPPEFKSQIHGEPKPRDMAAANSAGNQSRAEGRGWAGGTLHHMAKPLLAKAAP